MTATAVIGYAGTLLYLVDHAYISLSSAHNGRIYFAGNMIAATCLVITSAALSSWQPVIVNLFWAGISLQRMLGGSVHILVRMDNWLQFAGGVCLLILAGSLGLMPERFLSVLAWISVLMFAGAYLLFAAEQLQKSSYLLLNGFAALAILPQLWLDTNYPAFVLESVWAVLSFYGVLHTRRTSRIIQ
jgi:hypothetical protein